MSEIRNTTAGTVPVRVYRPDGTPRGALLWAHGGGFQHGSIDMPEADWVAGRFSSAGYTVVSVDYRLAPTVHFPAPSNDILTAWRWLVEHRDELAGRDPLHLGGASAGGNLVAGATLRLRDGDPEAAGAPLPDSLLLAYPALHAAQPAPPAELERLLSALPVGERWTAAQVEAMYVTFLGGPIAEAVDAASPGSADPRGFPPTIVVASESDGLRVSAETFVARLEQAGVPHEYVVEPGTRHGHLNRPDEPAATATMDRFIDWLRRHG